MEAFGRGIARLWHFLFLRCRELLLNAARKLKPSVKAEATPRRVSERAEPMLLERAERQILSAPPPPPKPVIVPRIEAPREKKKIEVDPSIRLAPGELPPYTLLNESPAVTEKAFSNISFEALSSLVEQRLSDFGVEAKVQRLPLFTRLNWIRARIS